MRRGEGRASRAGRKWAKKTKRARNRPQALAQCGSRLAAVGGGVEGNGRRELLAPGARDARIKKIARTPGKARGRYAGRGPLSPGAGDTSRPPPGDGQYLRAGGGAGL